MDEAGTVTFDAAGLITAVAQDAETGEVLMVAHMTREALERTLATRQGWYWSRSRRRLWRKGEESGHTQRVREVRIDCDGDAVLLRVDQVGPACHTGHRSCFYRGLRRDTQEGIRIAPDASATQDDTSAGAPDPTHPLAGPEILTELAGVLADRRENPRKGSYSAQLFAEGLARLNEKIMEEAAEVTRAARKETPERLVEEAADLWFHTLALLVFQGIDPARVFAELARRRR
jgi:phosphoribosyl-AMP cyclohydrolase / phosphoribosyl-ATP pyrophosphohydrolase